MSHFHGAGGGNVIGMSQNYKGQTFGIWYYPGANPSLQDITRQSLIVKGWKEVIPYRGEEEVQRLKGKTL